MANYVAMVRFDENTNKKLLSLQEVLAVNGFGKAINEWPPHITIAACNGVNESDLLQWAKEYSSHQSRFKVGLFALSILPPGGEHNDTAMLCLNPSHSKTLVDFYYRFHENLEDYCKGIGWYNSIRHGNPAMHCSIGVFNVKGIQKVQEIIFTSNVFGEAEIKALEIYAYPMRLIKRFEFDAAINED